MSKKFNIIVDGVAHEVEVEELGGSFAPVAPVAAAAPAAAPKAAPAPAPKAAPAAPKAAAGAGDLTAPLQGTILSVDVNAGDSVKAGQTVVVIEAMKMENEIVAPADGVVKAIYVKKGDNVSAGDLLAAFN